MNTDSLYLGTVFFSGILSFLSPCVFPLLPVYLSSFANESVIGEHQTSKRSLRLYLLMRTLLFVAGVASCFIVLGFGAGFLGSFINNQFFIMAMGIIVVIMGLHQTGLIKISKLYQTSKVEVKRAKKTDAFGIFLLGLTFSFGWTPCVGPVLAAILGLSASSSTALYGGFLMAVYSLGFAVPFLILALFSEVFIRKSKWMYRHLNKIKIFSGIIIILMGLFLMTNNLNLITVWAEKLFNS